MLSRRALLGGMLSAACTRRERSAPRPASGAGPVASASTGASVGADASESASASAGELQGSVRVLQWDFDSSVSPHSVIVVPAWGPADAKYPVLVALHGRGEALKPPEEGAMGWPRDYAMLRAIERLHAPPLRVEDFEGFVYSPRLKKLNTLLGDRPFQGLIVACPYLPDLTPSSTRSTQPFSRFVIDELLPRVRRETPALTAPASTGIDGVSLGGATALRVGLTNPEAFGAVAALQPAVQEEQAYEWTEVARAARGKNKDLRLRLVTSTDDYFLKAVERLSESWRWSGVTHDFLVVPGPHDYAFNRGPGSIEMLFWHDATLAHAG